MKCERFNLATGLAVFIVVLTFLITPSSVPAAEKGFIGMQVQGMSEKIAKALGLKSKHGVLVRDVALGGASDKAGFQRGDLILEFGGTKIDSFETMAKAASATKPGQKIKVAILRAGKPVSLILETGKWTPAWQISKSAVASLPASGLTMASLTPKLRKGFGLRWSSIGVVVTLVDPDRTDISLRRGDLIVQVNQQDVWVPDQVVSAYKEAKKNGRKTILLLVERVDGFRFMALPVR
ncbi:MAG: PDZ domain-containing protein [Alphaproteobacteria bacterium]|nr:PDZ domain-containing protein [Alphaproteobacteria bacterium]